MISNWINRLTSQNNSKQLRRRVSEQRRARSGVKLMAETLEDRRLLATLFWQGDIDNNMSTVGNWADDIAGNDTGALPAAGDTLVFNTDTVGLGSRSPIADLPAATDNLTLQFVDNDGFPGSPWSVSNGGTALGIVGITVDGAIDERVDLGALLVLNADTTIVSNTPARINLVSEVSGNFDLTVDANTTISMFGQFLFTGLANINGVLTGQATFSTSAISINAGGSFTPAQFPATGPLTIQPGGTLGPFGLGGGQPASGDLVLTNGSNFDVALDAPGTAPTVDFSNIAVNGIVDIGAVTFNLTGTHVPATGEQFVIISNDGFEPVNLGAFAPAEGAAVGVLNGVPMRITYVGGDGNDVALEAIPSAIIGYKFEDLDADGIEDFGEPRLNGVLFELNDGINPPLQVVTGDVDLNGDFFIDPVTESGIYRFLDLPIGVYFVSEVLDPGFGLTTTDPSNIGIAINGAGEAAVATAGLAADLGLTELILFDLAVGNAVEGSIHGFKFEDVDADGQYSPFIDVPLPGVEFTLTGFDGQGNFYSINAFTDFNGEFWFENLFPSVAGQGQGTGYTVTETVPAGFVPTTPVVRTFDLESRLEFVWTNGAANLQPGDPQVEFLADSNQDGIGDELMFGNTVPGSIHGFKFEDIDGDGVYDPRFDFPLAGVDFTLTGFDAQGNFIFRTETTGGNGEFGFTGILPSVAGQGAATGYTLTENVPAGFVPTTPVTTSFDLRSREELVWTPGAATLPFDDPRFEIVYGDALVFGNTVPGSIHGFKFEDRNGDGFYNPAIDVPLAGVEFQLTGISGLGFQINLTVNTDINGEFWFVGLMPSFAGRGPGTGYTVTEIVPPGYVATTPTVRSFDLESRVEFVWTPGAAMLPPFGDPRFEVLADSNLDGIGDELMFGNALPGAIHGYKFEDFNANGVNDPGEQRLLGWEIQLLDANGNLLDTQFTDGNGEYWFEDLLPGTYFVREVQVDGWRQSTHSPPPLTIVQGEVYVSHIGQGMLDPNDPREEILEKCLVFGNYLTSSIHGYKFHDLDGNGFDSGEPRWAGVSITLTGDSNGDGIGDVQIVQTDVNGEYWFEDLFPGIYLVTETPPTGSIATTQQPFAYGLAPGEELSARFGMATLGPDQYESVYTDLAFGNTYPGSIHGYKFYDRNGNGLDDGESRISGVTITLTGDTNGDGFIESITTLTNVNGEYWFEGLYPGFYNVTETPPANSFPTTNVSVDVFIVSGEEAVAEFGQSTSMGPLGPGQFESFPNSDLAFGNIYFGAIHGHKFEDIDGDGVEDPGDQRLNGFTITLTDLQGNPVFDAFGNFVGPVLTAPIDLDFNGAITANEQGLYWFTNLLPGTYVVREEQIPGFAQTTHDPQPITITGGQIYVAKLDQAEGQEFDGRDVIVDKCLSFGNQDRGQIYWRKEDKHGELLGAVTFTLTRTHSYDKTTGLYTDIVDEPITVQDNLAPDVDSRWGLFAVQDLQLGRYILEETNPVPGYDPDTFVEIFQVTDFNKFHDASHVWVNSWSKRAFVGSTYDERVTFYQFLGLVPNPQPIAAVDDIRIVATGAQQVQLDVLANDFANANSAPLRIVAATAPNLGGNVAFDNDYVYYTPAPGLISPPVETFTYTVSNGNFISTAQVTVFAFPGVPNLIAPIPAVLGQGEGLSLDVNLDGSVSPLDALIVINNINDDSSVAQGESAGGQNNSNMNLDTSGDNIVSPLDVLLIINYINGQSASQGESVDVRVVADSAPAGENLVEQALAPNVVDTHWSQTPAHDDSDSLELLIVESDDAASQDALDAVFADLDDE
ncbi:MAG: protocatechuate 3,4-dioxygenase beta subunit [Pirellulaceae bacterium]|jgi:protocatechuate 3,4-dioxygenase beta subunit